MNDLEKVNKVIENNTLSELKAFGDSSYQAIVADGTKAVISEEAFKQSFLPYFSGNVAAVGNRNVITEWISVAGTAMSEVDVINSKNEVLFTVPALFDSNVIDLTKRVTGSSIADIVEDYNLRKDATPHAATKIVNASLDNRLKEIIADGASIRKTTAERWIAIMGRYGIAPPSDRLPSQPVDENKEGNDDVIYE